MSATIGKVKRPSVCEGRSVVTLVVMLLSGAVTAVPVAADWELPITASVSTMQVYSDIATAAVQTGATDGFDGYSIDQPHAPAPPVGIRVYFAHPVWGQAEASFSRDARASIAPGRSIKAWTFAVQCIGVSGAVALTFDVAAVPATYEVWLTDGADGTRYNLRTASYPGYTAAAGATRAFTLEVGQWPDLVVTNVTASPTSPTVGQTVTLTATIRNQGTVAAPAFGVYAFRHRATAPTSAAGADDAKSVSGLAVGVSTNVPLAVSYTATGTYKAWVMVDGWFLVPESDETNNYGPANGLVITVSAATPKPDLVVTNVTASPTNPGVGEMVTLTATIRNQGTVAAPAFGVYAFRHRATAPTSAAGADDAKSTSALAAGVSTTVTLTVSYSQVGTYKIWVLVDGWHLVPESDETNNYGPANGLTINVGS